MKTQDNKSSGKWVSGLIVIIIVGAIIAIAVSSQSKNPTNSTSADKTSQPAKAEEKSAKWDYEEQYNKIQNGMTKAEVETAIDRKSDNCAETQSADINLKVEACNYGMPPDNGMISVTYENGKASGKAKAKF